MTTPPIKPAPEKKAAKAPGAPVSKAPAKKAPAKKAAPVKAAGKAPASTAPTAKAPVTAPAPMPAKLTVVPDPRAASQPAAEPKPLVAINLPFVSASLTIPGPGAKANVGPVSVTLPTGVLYYGGVGALAVAGAIGWPVAVGLGAGGFLYRKFSGGGK